MLLRAYCEGRFRITVSLGPGSALGGKRQITRSNRKNIGDRRKPSAVFFFFFSSPKPIFSPFPHNAEPGPTLDYSQTEKIMNIKNISGMLLCCEKKTNQR